jgi:hypothetical protein
MLRNAAVSLCSAGALLLAIGAVSGQVAVAQSAQFAGVLSAQPGGAFFTEPSAIALGTSSNIYVSDVGVGNVGVYEIVGGVGTPTQLGTGGSGSPFVHPSGLAVDAAGDVFVADKSTGYVYEIAHGSNTAVALFSTSNPFSQPAGVAVDSSQNLYVADYSGAVYEAAWNGTSYTNANVSNLGVALGFSVIAPSDIAVTPDGLRLFVADNGAGNVFEIANGSQTAIVTASANAPWGVALDAHDNLYVAFNSAHQITEYFASSGYTTSSANWGSGLAFPSGVAVDASGNIFTANNGGNVVEISPAAPNFGSVPVGATSSSVTLAFSLSGTLGATPTAALSQGDANGEFADTGAGTCAAAFAGTDCTVVVTFAPEFSGTRNGAIELLDAFGNALGVGYAYGAGSAPSVIFRPASSSTPYTVAHAGTLALGLAVDPAGNLFIADNAGAQVLENGVPVSSITPLTAPEGIALDGAGNLYVADSGHVFIFALSNSTYTLAHTFTIANASLVAVDGAGNVYITTTGGTVYKETLFAGAYTQSVVGSSPISNPLGLATDVYGDTYTNAASSVNVVYTSYSVAPSLTSATTTPWGTLDSDYLSVELLNIGNADLTYSVAPAANSLTPAITGIFGIDGSSSCTSTLAAGSNCTFDLDFTPAATGTNTGSLTFTDNDLNVATPTTIGLSGQGSKATPTFGGTGAYTVTYDGNPHTAAITATGVLGANLNADLILGGTTHTHAGVYHDTWSFTDPTLQYFNSGPTAITDTINPATGTVTITAGTLTQTYTGAPLPVSYTAGPGPQAVTVTYTGTGGTLYGPSTTAPSAVGTYTVVAAINAGGNYTGSDTETLTIAAASASVTLGSLAQTYTGSPMAATYVTTPGGLTASLTYTGTGGTVYATSATPPTNAGSYTVAATITSPGYTGSTSGTLVISKATATIALGSLSPTYTGSPLAATAVTTPLGLTVNLTYTGTGGTVYPTSSTPPTVVGSYTVAAAISDANYSGSNSGTLNIGKATGSVALTNLSQVYTGSSRPVTVTTTPSGLAYTISYTGTSVVYGPSATAPTGVGTYSVTATVNDPNHTAGTSTVTYNITKATPVISWINPVTLWWPNPLTTAQLNASASFVGGPVAGVFTYSPLAGTVLLPSSTPYTLSVSFVPTDLVDFLPGPFTATVPLTVVQSTVTIQGISTPIGYPQELNLEAVVIGGTSGKPVHNGTVTYYDGNHAITPAFTVNGNGTYYWETVPPLSVGTHNIWVQYSGDSYNPAGYSATYPIVITGAQTTINPGCSSSSIAYGTSFYCNIHLSASTQKPPQGQVTYTVTGPGSAVQPTQTLTLSPSAGAYFKITEPAAGSYSVLISYASQGDFGAASITENFTVNPAQTIVSLTPSTWNPTTATTLVLSAAVASPSAGAPDDIGSIAFTDGGTPLPGCAAVGVSSVGQATCTVTGLALGGHNFQATYTGTNYATGSVSINVNVVAAKAAAKPIFSPVAGTYATSQSISIADSTPGAVIHFTTDNSTPTAGSPVYSGPFTITQSTEVQAIAIAAGYNNSPVAQALYDILVPPAAPTFSPVTGPCSGPQTVTISDATPSTAIYYTTDGSTPTVLHSPLYSAPVTGVACPGTVKAIAVLTTVPGNTPGATSPVGTANYWLQVAATPVLTASGKFTVPTTITITDSTPAATIYYTTNGTTPTTSSAHGSSPISIPVSATETVSAFAAATGYTSSKVASARYMFSTVTLTAQSTKLTYPGQTNLTACVTNNNNPAPTGTFTIVDTLSSTTLTTISLQGNGCAYWYISPGLAGGSYSLQAQYSGDANFPAGDSPLVPITVGGVQVSIAASCSAGSVFSYGMTPTCQATLHSNGGVAPGSITYQLDGGSANPVALNAGDWAGWTLPTLDAGKHVMLVSYPGSSNFGSASQTIKFTITPAPVSVAVAPSAYSLSVGTSFTAVATVTSSAGTPGTGTISFYDNGFPAGTFAISAGSASFTTTNLKVGTHQITATYSGATDYAAGSSAPQTITVGKATPTLTWATPAPITYGTVLTTTQLDATASVAGTYVYSPAAGAVVSAGSQTLNVTFTPSDKTNYTTATATVTLVVNKATPTVSAWPTASSITSGQTLASSTLTGGTASVAGAFAWTTPTTVPPTGTTSESVTFIPSDTTDYNTPATGLVSVTAN